MLIEMDTGDQGAHTLFRFVYSGSKQGPTPDLTSRELAAKFKCK